MNKTVTVRIGRMTYRTIVSFGGPNPVLNAALYPFSTNQYRRPLKEALFYSLFIDEEATAQKSYVTCPTVSG